MKFTPTPLEGAFLIDLEKREDERGFFARLFCSDEFQKLGLDPAIVQINNSLSAHEGTLRGMHYQTPPYQETKVVRCLSGSLYDVILDLRKDSPTFGCSWGTELSSANRKMIYVPKGFAHGFLTLEPDTELLYLVSEKYRPEHERGIRWDDPYFNIDWPQKPKIVSEKDCAIPDFQREYHLGGTLSP